MRERKVWMAIAGLIGLLILASLSGAALAQSPTPGVTATLLPSITPTHTPTHTPTLTPVRTATRTAVAVRTATPVPVLPVTGHQDTARALYGLLPVVVLLLLALPALGRFRARRR